MLRNGALDLFDKVLDKSPLDPRGISVEIPDASVRTGIRYQISHQYYTGVDEISETLRRGGNRWTMDEVEDVTLCRRPVRLSILRESRSESPSSSWESGHY